MFELELLLSENVCLYSWDSLLEEEGGLYSVNTGGGLYRGFLFADFLTFLLSFFDSKKLDFSSIE